MSRHTHTTLTVSTLALTALLASCGRTTAPQISASTDAVMTVLQPGTATDAQLEATYGGHLITRTPGFAVLTLSSQSARLAPLSAKVKVEKNHNVFRVGKGKGQTNTTVSGSGSIGVWGNGSIGVWGNGSIGVWGNGSIGVWGNGEYKPIPQNSDTWQQISLNAVQSTERAGGVGMTVAVIDTGVDLNHPAIRGGFTDPTTWHDFVDGDATPQDEGTLGSGLSGHGTEVAGIVAQVAPVAKIMPLRVLAADGTGDVASVAAAIVWATDHGANVINLSLGSAEPVTAVTQAIAYANSHGVAIAAAAGNAGTEGLDYPAAEFASQPLNIAVGSVDLHDAKSAFSQYASNLELLAPGERVFGPAPQERFAAWSGTSMSAPVVAGGLALGMSVGANGAQAAAALTSTATSVDTVSGNASYAGKLGAGRVNLDAAIASLGH